MATLYKNTGSGSGSTVATGITTDTTNFGNVLSTADNTVQKALDTIDDMSLPTLPAVTGTYYTTTAYGTATTANAALVANRLHATPFFVRKTMTFDRIGISVTTGTGVGTDRARLGIYRDNNGVPGTRVLDAGEVDVSAIANVEITISQQLTPGWYWVTIVSNAAPTIKMMTATGNAILPIMGWNSLGMSNKVSYLYTALAYTPGVTTLPDPFGAITQALALNIPMVAIRPS